MKTNRMRPTTNAMRDPQTCREHVMMHRVNTRSRVPAKRARSEVVSAFFSLVVPESDFIELRTRADELTIGGCSEHAATLAAAMCAGKKTPRST